MDKPNTSALPVWLITYEVFEQPLEVLGCYTDGEKARLVRRELARELMADNPEWGSEDDMYYINAYIKLRGPYPVNVPPLMPENNPFRKSYQS